MKLNISLAILYMFVISTFENAYIFSICFLTIILLSNLFSYLINKFTHSNINIIIRLLFNTLIITIISSILNKYIPTFYNDMNIYLVLLILIIPNIEKDSLKDNIKYTLKESLIFIGILLITVLIKEIIGMNRLTLMDNLSYITGYREVIQIYPKNNILPISFMNNAGSFILIGLVIGIVNKIRGVKSD